EVIACSGNFHGRTIAIVAMSDEPQYQHGFGPFPPGFRLVDYGDIDALEGAINDNTAAFLVEPIQGEAGIVLPPDGYLKDAAELCRKHNVLLIADEIQTGLGRTGKLLASEHENVKPDGLILGKALGGGILPVSMFLARRDVMEVFEPGDHGSTFGGNPFAAAVGLEALRILVDEDLAERSRNMGDYLLAELKKISSPLISDVRGRGLFVGVEIDPSLGRARDVCKALMERGLLSKETHHTVVRLAPPLCIGKQEIDWAVATIRDVIDEMDQLRLAS
ncbi:MAG: aminotransferase class III-fold pyridoxal phosphate-dependent enzyme, partial [Woeseiaceae bacterium]|nr:aminotransferase class III-fold pyridoxal phosphate-dependent enzyme [Woeseiaceae bacterium]